MLSWLIPSLISIIGFIVSFFTLKVSFKNEIGKQKNAIAIEKLQAVAKFFFTEHLTTISPQEKSRKYAELYDDMLLYGSSDLSKLAIDYQRNKYKREDVVIYKALLCSQLKYETSGYYINAVDFMKITIRDYDKFFKDDELRKKINLIIKTQGYNKKLKC